MSQLIGSTHLLIDIPSVLFHSDFAVEFWCPFLLSLVHSISHLYLVRLMMTFSKMYTIL